MAVTLNIDASVVSIDVLGDRATIGVQVKSNGLQSGFVTLETDSSAVTDFAVGACELVVSQGS